MPEYLGKDLEAMSFAVNYHQWIIDEFKPYLGETIAEVGAGMGNISQLLLKASNTPIKHLLAFEPSDNMYPLLEERLHQEQRAEAVHDFFTPHYRKISFDSIVYINVLEHIQDDRAELTLALQALKPNGYLLVFVPALSWLYSDLDRQIGHFRRYSKQEVSHLITRTGFNLVKVRYFDFAGIIPWYLNFVVLRHSMSSSSVALYDKIVVPLMRWVEYLITPPIGKNLLVIAQKPAAVTSFSPS